MRTVFVNPSATFSNPRKKRRKKRAAAKAPKRAAARRKRHAAPKRRKRRSVYVTKRGGGMRRVNAGITPFVANPLSNPRRRRKRKRNPMGMAMLKQPKVLVVKALSLGGGAAAGTAVNLFGLRRIQNDWYRNGARVVAAVAGAIIVPGDIGSSMAGATLYPLFAEVAMKLGLVEAPATEIDLNEMGIDLEDVMNDGEDGGDMLFDW